ncbi:hypothetical protein [Mycoplasmopsis mucosicanis]|nr:hypothetical protein [Mycoplasmopsis mucosicanis]
MKDQKINNTKSILANFSSEFCTSLSFSYAEYFEDIFECASQVF